MKTNTILALSGIPAEPAMLQDILTPDWNWRKHGLPVHDWRVYVPQQLRQAWPLLSAEARLAAYLVAESTASHECWD